MPITKRETLRLVRYLERQGAEVVKRKKGFTIRFPDGSTMGVHMTPSDGRSDANTRARVRRAGLHYPGDPSPRKD